MRDVKTMFHGPGGQGLLVLYRVSYFVIGPHEFKDAHANLAYYHRFFPVVYRAPSGEYQVFKVG
jgi:hypothetical protein